MGFIQKRQLRNLLLVPFLFSLLLTACEPTRGNTLSFIPRKVHEPLITWTAFNGGGTRMGINTAEREITPANLGSLKRIWQEKLPDIIDGSPVLLPNVHTGAGTKNILFATTKSGSLLAIDTETSTIIWSQGTPGPKFTTSSPAIDPSGKFVYSYGLDGKVHKYTADSGQEISTGGWPAVITLMPNDEKGSSSLNIGNGYLYATISGYPGDRGHYEGHVVAVNLATGKATVFNVLCANITRLLVNTPSSPNYCPAVQAGVWARAGAMVDPVTGNVFIVTGNGDYDANKGGHNYGDTVIELSSDVTHLIDTYTPANYPMLQDNDADLGSSDPVMLPKQNKSKTPYMAVQAGKDNVLRLLNRQNLSGMGGPNHIGGELQTIALPNACSVLSQPLAWNDANNTTWLFVTNGCGLSAFQVVTDSKGKTTLRVAYHNGHGGSSPFMANNMLFIQSNGVLMIINPTTGSVLWSSDQPSASGSIGDLHWQSPIVVNARIYVPDNNGNLSAYGLV